MNYPSIIFWSIFVIPLIGALVWLMRQDKRKGITGILILAIILVGCIIYMKITKQFN
jgi:glucan phosphoethanolaminetransferase (alkaline phosphatase superfamily)